MYDVVIIGAGPAGSTLARLIGDRYRVLLVDKRQGENPAEGILPRKCCGGLLAPDAQKMLSTMGLGLPKSVLAEPQLFVVRAIDLPQRLERFYQRYYINMDRQQFDRWLLSMVPPSVEVRTGCRFLEHESGANGFALNFLKDAMPVRENTRILVGADGALSRVRSATEGNARQPQKYIAIQEWVECERPLPYFSALFDPEVTDYYSWTIPKGDHLLIGAALPPGGELGKRFDLLRGRLKAYGFQFGRTVRREAGIILRPRNSDSICIGGRGVALIGEAAGWISPSSAEGLSYGFRSALMFAEALRPGIDGFERRYEQRARELKRNILLKNLKSHAIFNPSLRKLVMRSGIQTLEVARSSE